MAGAAMAASMDSPYAHAAAGPTARNIVLIISDQFGIDAISAHGCAYIHTPNIDRLIENGTSFIESHSTNPVCSPARSSMMTGRMPSETGVVTNSLPINAAIPNIGQWLQASGFDTVYTGKWHLPDTYVTEIDGFRVIPTGIGSQAHLGDTCISRSVQGYLQNRTADTPMLLVINLGQPHDIAQFVSMHDDVSGDLLYPQIADELPPMPDNFEYDSPEPAKVPANARRKSSWTEMQWRYYIWGYYRHVEMVDREIGRVVRTIEETGHAGDTLIIFTSDHGEGQAQHKMTGKNYLYEYAVKVPLIVSWPGHVREGVLDDTNLISGLDLTSTICDYAGVPAPPGVRGRSLRPLLQGELVPWRKFVVTECRETGLMLRTAKWKFITFEGDPVEQLFDMENDPGELVNLAGIPGHSSTVEELREMLRIWAEGEDPSIGLPEQTSEIVIPFFV
jgi:arylsulfatase A-like enzyme